MKPQDQETKVVHRHAHRYPGILKRRVRKALVELTPEEEVPEPSHQGKRNDPGVTHGVPPELHRQLRGALAEGPLSLGQLRRSYGFDPVMLLRETLGSYPDTYYEVDCDGHPGLGLRENAPPLDVQLDRQKVVPLIRSSGQNGIYLSTLHKASGFTSQHLIEILENAPGIECIEKSGRPIYRRSAQAAAEEGEQPVHEQESAGLEALEQARDELLRVLGSSQRMSNWLINQCGFDHGTLLGVLARYKDDFVVEKIETGVSSYLTISSAAESLSGLQSSHPPLPETPAGVAGPTTAAAPQVNNQPSDLVDEVLGAEVAARLRWRPPSPGMGSRRGGRVMKDGRDRPRHPLVQL